MIAHAPSSSGSKSRKKRSKASKPSRQYHFVVGGVLYVAVTTLLMLGALNSQNNLLFAAMGISIAGLVVSGVLSGSALLGVRVERVSISDAGVGRPLTIRYRVKNKNRIVPAFALVVEESYTRRSLWTRLLPQPRAFVAHVGPGQSVECEAQVWPKERGQVRLESIRVWSTFPFGIAKKSITQRCESDPVVVRPLVVPIRASMLRHKDGDSRSGKHPSRRAGLGDEFFSLREYIPGDSLRQIAWRATARTGQLVVTQPAQPVPDRLRVVLRFDSKTDSQPHNERAIALAASIITRAVRNATMVGIEVPQLGFSIPPTAGRRGTDRLLETLGALDLEELPTDGRAIALSLSGPRETAITVHARGVPAGADTRQMFHVDESTAEQWMTDPDAIEAFRSIAPSTGDAPNSDSMDERLARFASWMMSGREEQLA